MLQKNITSEFFKISCNPSFQKVSHIIVCGFALVGRLCDKNHEIAPNLNDMEKEEKVKQMIRNVAIMELYTHLREEKSKDIKTLIHFAA